MSFRRSTRRTVLTSLALVWANVALGQVVLPDVLPAADRDFAAALVQFESEDYEGAIAGFQRVSDDYAFNTKTTAAMLMAGKALYRAGRFDESALALKFFIDRYPRSRYVRAARETMRLAERAAEDAEQTKATVLGVLLPMSNDDLSLTQALFNGVRVAVEAHNASGDGRSPIRIVFRTSDGSDYDRVMEEFAGLGAAAVLGPLYSRQAVDAAAAAERNQVVLITPLATDERVAADREFVFQANPTATMRGRAIARFAVENLRHSQLGVIAEDGNALSERMAEGFEDEALRLGADVRFVMMLPSATGWFRLGDRLVADSLAGIQAIYLPITGGQARSLIKAAMDEFDNLEVQVRLLGNKEWNDLPSKSQPSRYNAVYTNDYHVAVGDVRVEEFSRAYEAIGAEEPNELAYVGYDLTQYLIYLMTSGSNRPLNEALRDAAPYNGLALRLDFRAGNVNSAMFFERYRNGVSELLY